MSGRGSRHSIPTGHEGITGLDGPLTTPVDPAASAAYAALMAIEAGQWDRYLLRLRAAIDQRRKTGDYAAHIIAS